MWFSGILSGDYYWIASNKFNYEELSFELKVLS